MAEGFHSLNVEESMMPTETGHVKLEAPPKTDIWRTPPSHDYLHAPIIYKSLEAATFRKAQVTVSAKWTLLYDQGGLLLVLPGKEPKKWVKAGTEMVEGKPQISVVAADRWADWSLQPQTSESLTVEFERKFKEDKLEPSLRIYVVEGGERRMIRKVTWAFEEENQDIWVGIYAARPDQESSEALAVDFSDLIVESV